MSQGLLTTLVGEEPQAASAARSKANGERRVEGVCRGEYPPAGVLGAGPLESVATGVESEARREPRRRPEGKRAGARTQR
ncbi:MAG: hypothetical protein KAG66_17645, partial [Methylococcales bacterium]|nr:hypothetical protein [Methylococcales bacterium]